MPLFSYECSFCRHEFDEIFKSYKNSGKTCCPKCGNIAFKIPAIFTPKIFKKRQFADGTETPDFVDTPSKEKAWLKSQGITLDKPTGREKRHREEERRVKSDTSLKRAFEKANKMVNEGFKIEGLKENKKVKGEIACLT